MAVSVVWLLALTTGHSGSANAVSGTMLCCFLDILDNTVTSGTKALDCFSHLLLDSMS